MRWAKTGHDGRGIRVFKKVALDNRNQSQALFGVTGEQEGFGDDRDDEVGRF